MIKDEIVLVNGNWLRRTYSDEGYKIQKVGTDEVYIEAYDVISSNFQYKEMEEKAE